MVTNVQASDVLKNSVLNWKTYLFGLMLGAILGLVTYKLMAPLFEGRVDIEIGKIAGSTLKAPDLTVARLRSPEFITDIVSESGDKDLIKWGRKVKLEFDSGRTSSYKVQRSRIGEFLQIKVRADSVPVVNAAMTAITTSLIRDHNEILDPAFENRKSYLEELRSHRTLQIDVLQDSRSLLKVMESEGNYLNAGLLQSKVVELTQSILGLEERIFDRRLEMMARSSYPTRLINAEPFIRDKPVFPNLFLLLVLGSFFGLILAVFFVRKRA